MINKLKYFVPESILYSLYCTLILPYINYGIQAWENCCKRYLEKIFKLQKKALRIISNSNYLSHSAPLFKKYKILNVYDTYDLEVCTFMYKHFNKHLPVVFDDYFNQINFHRYPKRNSEDYRLCLRRTEFANNTMRASGPKKWNSIDKNTRKAKSIKHFRSQIKQHLISKYI